MTIAVEACGMEDSLPCGVALPLLFDLRPVRYCCICMPEGVTSAAPPIADDLDRVWGPFDNNGPYL